MTNVNQENQTPENPRKDAAGAAGAGLPLRGLAMVLIAVAVMLALWALYAFTQDDSDASLAGSETPATGEQQAGQPSANGQAPAEGQTPAENQPAQPGSESEPPANGADGSAPAAAPAPAPGPAAPAEAPKRVSVLNNSMVQGLAANISDRLKSEGYELGEVGNFNEEILPETTVFFPTGDEVAEREALSIADKIGGIARENIDSLPEEATRDRGLTVVLTNNN